MVLPMVIVFKTHFITDIVRLSDGVELSMPQSGPKAQAVSYSGPSPLTLKTLSSYPAYPATS